MAPSMKASWVVVHFNLHIDISHCGMIGHKLRVSCKFWFGSETSLLSLSEHFEKTFIVLTNVMFPNMGLSIRV